MCFVDQFEEKITGAGRGWVIIARGIVTIAAVGDTDDFKISNVIQKGSGVFKQIQTCVMKTYI